KLCLGAARQAPCSQEIVYPLDYRYSFLRESMFRFIFLLSVLVTVTSCSHNNWEDMKTAGRYMQKSVDSILRKEYESRMLASSDDFYGPYDDDFIPLKDADIRNQYAAMDTALPQPKAIPGQFGLPSLNNFYAP